MIDIQDKRKTIEAADLSPQEVWWKENLLAAYAEIEKLRPKADSQPALLEALEKVEKITRFVDAWENRMEEIRIISAAAIAEVNKS